MATIKLTTRQVEAFECPTGKTQALLFDSKVPGLGVRATPAGAKSYIFETRLFGKTIRITIGDTRTWTLGKAQDEATRLKAMTDQGIDPREVRKQQQEKYQEDRKQAELDSHPALECWQEYLTAKKDKWSERSYADHLSMTKEGGIPRGRGRRTGESATTEPGILRPLLSKPLNSINADSVRAWLTSEATLRPTHARLAFSLLRGFLNWCADHPAYRAQVQEGACAARIARDCLPKKTAKDDCLQKEQLHAWFANVLAIPNPIISVYLQITLLTGARREEIAELQWQDVDFKWSTLTIRDKVEDSRTIPLTSYVKKILEELRDRANRDASVPWVFASPTAASGRLQEPRIQHNRACKAAGINGLTIHGLRRSFGTLAEWVECPTGISAQIMGHKPSALAEKHYRRRPIDLLRQWHQKIEDWILEQAAIEKTGSKE